MEVSIGLNKDVEFSLNIISCLISGIAIAENPILIPFARTPEQTSLLSSYYVQLINFILITKVTYQTHK